MTATETVTHCPFKGDATHWTVNGIPDAAWSYETPTDESRAIAGLVCLAHDDLTVTAQ